MNVSNGWNLAFFKITDNRRTNTDVCDYTAMPRPYFSIGLMVNGHAQFESDTHGKHNIVDVREGDLIFVPVTSRYISKWRGQPDIRYISYHFSFEQSSSFSERNGFVIQKISMDDENLFDDFEYSYNNYNGTEQQKLLVLSKFYKLLSRVYPILTRTGKPKYDERIKKAVEFINMYSEENMDIPSLAKMCNMSTSHFYSRFRQEVGATPVDYRNRILIGRAAQLLTCRDYASIEDISNILGFGSATYFRKLFKKVTGKTPAEYRKSAIEL